MARTIRASAFRGISGSDRLARRGGLSAFALAAALGSVAFADPLPTGGAVASGDVSIATPDARTMRITQGSDRAVVNWQSFDIGRGAHVDIAQPSRTSAILNRVTGDTTSDIRGRLTATGEVHLVNPNGIFIGPEGQVRAGGGFVASTLDIGDDDFGAGRLSYEGQGASAGVVNKGAVTIGRGGYAALVGGRVTNSGLVRVPLGRIGLAAGERVTLDVSGDGFLQVALPSEDDGDDRALIRNAGKVSARGGSIEMKAATARDAARNAINLSGVAAARSVSVSGGTITLGGGAGGTVKVSGRVTTRAAKPRARIVLDSSLKPQARPMGGRIDVTGATIALEGARIDASGAGGGGLIRIGGDFAGAGELPHADVLTGDAATMIFADALEQGDGGRIALWSDILTGYAGGLSARGGPLGGDGGFIEVSSKGALGFTGRADTMAPQGETGELLLDPYDVVISDAATDGIFLFGTTYDPYNEPSNLNTADLEGTLATTSVRVRTDNDSIAGGQAGDITVQDALDWATGTTLTLEAANNIDIRAGITAPLGRLALEAGGRITTRDAGTLAVDTFRLNTGDWIQNPDSQAFLTALPSFSANDFALDAASSSFLRVSGGSGTAGDPYVVVDAYGLQGIESVSLLDQSFVLGNDIDATGTTGWRDVEGAEGFSPIGDLSDRFNGTFDGQGFTVTGIFESPFDTDGGVFEAIGATGIVRNVTFADVDITSIRTGGLAADNFGTVSNVTVTGQVRGSGDEVGGLIANNEGTVTGSGTDLALIVSTSFGDLAIGGLIGSNSGTVSGSSAAGSVSVNALGLSTASAARIGGLVGDNEGDIDTASSSADVTVVSEYVPRRVGGLVGENSTGATITDATASGAVDVTSGADPGPLAAASSPEPFFGLDEFIGGFVGLNAGAIDGGTSSGPVVLNHDNNTGTAIAQDVGGFVGQNTFDGTIDNAVATAGASVTVTSNGEPWVGGFAGNNRGAMTNTSAAGDVTVTATLQSGVSFPPTVNAGGHTGNSRGLIDLATAEGAVSVSADFVSSEVGGFVGVNEEDGPISRARSFGDVLVTSNMGSSLGGFAGSNFADITDAHADGNVTYTFTGATPAAPSSIEAGGFIGYSGWVEMGPWNVTRTGAHGDVTVTAGPNEVFAGGHTGISEGNSIIDGYALGAVTTDTTQSGDNQAAGFVALIEDGALTNVFAAGAVSASGPAAPTVGGLIATNFSAAVTDSYFDMDTTGQSDPGDPDFGVGLNTADFEDTEAFFLAIPWDFANVWAPGDAGFYPEIYTIDRVVLAEPDDIGSIQYGLTPTATTTGSTVGGPDLYVFAPAGDALDTSTLFDSLTFADPTVGLRDFTLATAMLTSDLGDDYRVVDLPGQALITRAPLDLFGTTISKTYGDTYVFDGTEYFTTDTLYFGDTITSIDMTSTGADPGAAVADTHPVLLSNAQGSGLGNYDIQYFDGEILIDPARLDLTLLDQTKTYGEDFIFDGTEFTATGLVNGETITSALISSDGAPATADAGTYAIEATDSVGNFELTGIEETNYDIFVTDGTMTVNPAPLSITADNQLKIYGQTFPFTGGDFSATGLVNGETITSVTLSSGGEFGSSPVGTYAIDASDPQGINPDNYDIDFVAGLMTVYPAPLIIAASDQVKLLGELFTFAGTEFTAAGLVWSGDSVDSVTLSSPGAARSAGVDGSPYTITASDAQGTGLSNYDIRYESGEMLVTVLPGNSVPPPPLSITPQLPNPTDTIQSTLNTGGTAGPLSGGVTTVAVQPGAGPSDAVLSATETLAEVTEIAGTLEVAAAACAQSDADVSRYLACLSDALDDFANKLDEIATDLPPGMENVASIVQEARRQVDASRARAEQRLAGATSAAEREAIRRDALNEARSAVNTASSEIRKAITLVRADDPELAGLQTETITKVAAAVDSVSIELSRAVGL